MLRSLWSAASGMMAQQMNLDTISNNIANINTTGFKTQSMEFKSLLYQQLKAKSTDSEGNPKPIGVQVGLGVRNSSVTAKFTQGAALDTEEKLDLFIQGNGFFAVKIGEKTAYTRNGHFGLSAVEGGWELTNSDGNPVLSTKGTPIKIDSSWDPKDISIDTAGNVLRRVDDKEAGSTKHENLGKIALYQFNNPAGLSRSGGSLYYETPASGEARSEETDTGLSKSLIKSGYLEASNVSAADEMVNMIVTQRAYQLNSKAITASDEMLEQANNLRR
ncbi:MAG: flagellar hook-basal body protein [Catonella sp.]|uniref:flagellar hook-basal body protein n=1 Tax=Catonella sp. TaxID=2382125 RepID=UPI003F9EE645